MALSVGDLIGNKYKILKHLGRGGLGDVYLAQDRLLARKVAIKHLRPGSAREQANLERFLAEARTIARISHENVVSIFDAIEEDGGRNYYLVMECADEGTVADLLHREGRLPIPQALELGLAVAQALEVVHAKGILHGDIKPSNILLMSDRGDITAKLADFGLSRVVAGADTDQTAYSGSILYSAPEQLQGEAVGHRADLYALGVVLYEMLVGQPPFPYSGRPEDLTKVIESQLEEPPVPPSQLVPDVSPAVDELVLKLLSKAPDERYPDARALGQALRQALQTHRAWQERVQTSYAQGIEHEERGEWEQTVTCYEAVVAEQPGHAEAQRRLVCARENLDWRARYKKGVSAYDRSEWVEAEEILSQVVDHDEDYAGGDAADKLSEARRQLELKRLYEEARHHEAEGRWSEAIGLYIKILTQESDYKDVSARLAHAVEQQKLQTLYDQARGHIENQAWAEAVKTLQELERLKPAYKDSAALLAKARRQKRLHELYTRANQFLEEGEWDSAVETFNELLQIEPKYKDAAIKRAVADQQARLAYLYAQAEVQRESEDWAAAAVTLQEITEIAPSYQDASRLLEETAQKRHVADAYEEGLHFYEQKEWEQAIQCLEQVQQLQPGYRQVEQTLAEAQSAQRIHALYSQARQLEVEEKWTEAASVYSEISRLDPNDRDAKVGLQRVSAAALRGEQPDERREVITAVAAAVLIVAALSCMLFAPISRIAGAIPLISKLTPSSSPTPYPRSTVTPSLTPTDTPTPSPSPSPSPTPTDTPTPTPSPIPPITHLDCVGDRTIPDVPRLRPGTPFTKCWGLRSATLGRWPDGVRLVFVGGDQMGGRGKQTVEPPLTSTETFTVSVSLQAPAADGEYTGVWQIQDADGITLSEVLEASVVVYTPPTPTSPHPRPELAGIGIIKCNVTFRWTWPRTLAEDEWFALRVGKVGGEPPHSVAWTKEQAFTHTLDAGGDYRWMIVVCRGDPEKGDCEKLAASEQQPFSFGGCPKPPPEPPPP
jgi:tetratricopeptide (TPR) repeat protein/tRNA A-37 threonylcarbamoyl transferase component Bud32